MENHDSLHINPLISNAFKYARFVEKFGTGIPKMLNACKVKGNPEPECKVYEKSISLVLKPSEKYMLHVGNYMEGGLITSSEIQMSSMSLIKRTMSSMTAMRNML